MKDFKPVTDCIINKMFFNSNQPYLERLKYCDNNCKYKCINKLDYKKTTIK